VSNTDIIDAWGAPDQRHTTIYTDAKKNLPKSSNPRTLDEGVRFGWDLVPSPLTFDESRGAASLVVGGHQRIT
jgi:hypothetical protein